MRGLDKYILAYRAYLVDPSERNATVLAAAMARYGHVASIISDELHDMFSRVARPVPATAGTTLRTNGSTKTIRSEYVWGPNFEIFQNVIFKIIHRSINYNDARFLVMRNKFKPQKRNDCLCWCGCRTLFIKTDDSADQVRRRVGDKTLLVMTPATAVSIAQSEELLSGIARSAAGISITEFSPLGFDLSKLREVLPIIDQMRAWAEGVTFHECEHGERHFLEFLFHADEKGVTDLLNLCKTKTPKTPNQDMAIPDGPFRVCKCGIVFRDFKFSPHATRWFRNTDGSQARRPNVLQPKFCAILNEHRAQILQTGPGVFELRSEKPVSDKDLRVVNMFMRHVIKGHVHVTRGARPLNVGANEKKPVFWNIWTPESL